MGRQACMTRMTLGRSAFERPDPEDQGGQRRSDISAAPSANLRRTSSSTRGGDAYVQQYDSRGHPENPDSRALGRRTRRAQNDVLATVGVCVNVDKNGRLLSTTYIDNTSQARPKVALVSRENQTGFHLDLLDTILWTTANHSFRRLRSRLLTFESYSGIPLLEIWKNEQKYFGPLQMAFGGAPGGLIHILLDFGISHVITVVLDYYRDALLPRIDDPGRREWLRAILGGTQVLSRLAVEFVLGPLEIFIQLQYLDLIPSKPILPNLYSLVPFTSSSPIQLPPPSTFSSRKSLAIYICTLATSPFVLGTIAFYAHGAIDSKLRQYARHLVIRPENPDHISIESATEQQLDEEGMIPGLERPRTKDLYRNRGWASLSSQIKADIQGTVDDLCTIGHKLQDQVLSIVSYVWYFHNQTVTSSQRRSPSTSISEDGLAKFITAELAPPIITGTTTPPGEPSRGPSAPIVLEPDRTTRSEAPSPSLSASNNSDQDHHLVFEPIDNNNNVQVITRAGSTDTLHMNVEINANSAGAPTYTSSFSASPRPTVVETTLVTEQEVEDAEVVEGPKHRVTALTSYPSEMLVQHLSYLATDLLLLPLEAAYLRSIALGFLGAPLGNREGAADAAGWLNGQVFPMGTWFGYGLGRSGARDYGRKMILCLGMETMVGFSIWQLGIGAAWWAGRRWYRWGNL